MNTKGEGRSCFVCGKLGIVQWTVSAGDKVAIADLCVDHAAPLEEIVEATSKRETEKGKPWEKPIPQKVNRSQTFEPLAWEPPKE